MEINYRFQGDTLSNFDEIVSECKSIFLSKLSTYGPSWRHFRPSSLTDQMLIKAKRIRQLEETGHSAVGEGIEPEFVAIANYAVITIYQIRNALPDCTNNVNDSIPEIIDSFNQIIEEIRSLMIKKNQDYGEAWRDMLPTSLTDMIVVKLMRIRELLTSQSVTGKKEAESNLQDIFNYSIFSLIKKRK